MSHRAGKPPISQIFMCYSPQSFLVIRFSDFIFAKNLYRRHRAVKSPILPIFVCYTSPSFFVIWNCKFIFAKNLQGCPLKPYLWSQLVTTAKTTNLPGQTSLEQVNPLFGQFSCAIVHHLFYHPEFEYYFDQKFRQTSVKTLFMETDQKGPFLMSNS